MIETNTLPFVVSVYPYLCQSICLLIRQSVCLSVPSVYPPIFSILTRKVFFQSSVKGPVGSLRSIQHHRQLLPSLRRGISVGWIMLTSLSIVVQKISG